MAALCGCIIIAIMLGYVVDAINRASGSRQHQADAAYWRKAYEDLVKQSGRDLNDGLGFDKRSMKVHQ